MHIILIMKKKMTCQAEIKMEFLRQTDKPVYTLLDQFLNIVILKGCWLTDNILASFIIFEMSKLTSIQMTKTMFWYTFYNWSDFF